MRESIGQLLRRVRAFLCQIPNITSNFPEPNKRYREFTIAALDDENPTQIQLVLPCELDPPFLQSYNSLQYSLNPNACLIEAHTRLDLARNQSFESSILTPESELAES